MNKIDWPKPARQKVFGALMLLLFEAVLSVAFYNGLTKNFPGANDFYVPWRATQALLLEGRDPYSAAVTHDIQIELFGQPRAPDQHQFGYAYPLYTSLLLAPLVWLPYDAATAVWYAALLSLIVGSGLLALRNLDIELKPLPLSAMALWIVLFYPSARSLILGQLAVVVFACTVGAWWAVRHQRETLAGCLLALTTIKPQMVFLWLPLALAWAIQQRKVKLLQSFVATLSILGLLSLALQPRWPIEFLQTASAYTGYFDSPSPLQMVFSNDAFALAVSLGLAFALLRAAMHSAQRSWTDQLRLCMWAIIITQLVAVHTATTNQVMLMLPIFFALARSPIGSRSRFKVTAWLLCFLLIPWLVFLATRQGNTESAIALLPISLGVFGWWLMEAAYKRTQARLAILARH